MHIHLIHVMTTLVTLGIPSWVWSHISLTKKVRTAEAVAKVDETAIRAKVAIDINKALNDIRADETILTTHPNQIISRVREDLRKVL